MTKERVKISCHKEYVPCSFQVILEALSLSASPEVTCSYVHSLIGCCQSLMSSATLSYIFIGRLDQMVGIMILCR